MNPGAALAFLNGLAKPAKVALVVGTALCLINGTFASGDVFRTALNYLVPLLVSAYSRLALQRELRRAGTGLDGDKTNSAPEPGPTSGAAAFVRQRKARGIPNDRR